MIQLPSFIFAGWPEADLVPLCEPSTDGNVRKKMPVSVDELEGMTKSLGVLGIGFMEFFPYDMDAKR